MLLPEIEGYLQLYMFVFAVASTDHCMTTNNLFGSLINTM